MPFTCYGYPADLPRGSGNGSAAQAVRRGLREMPNPCYRYPIMCFSDPDDMPRNVPGRDGAPSAPPGLLRMPFGSCFRY